MKLNIEKSLTKNNNVFFISDLHFGHKNILKYSPNTRAPVVDTLIHNDLGVYSNIDNQINIHDEYIVYCWNNTVKENDVVFVLGDITLSCIAKSEELLSRLNGKIICIPGNHDSKKHIRRFSQLDNVEYIFDDAGRIIKTIKIPIKNYELVLCHYNNNLKNYNGWDKSFDDKILIHGHLHSENDINIKKTNTIEVCIDTLIFYRTFWKCYKFNTNYLFAPLSVNELEYLFQIYNKTP
jgi:calcineurin-like phosphoesterase family protein